MTPVVAAKKISKFDTKTFLSTINGGRKIEGFPKKQTIFAQGDSSDAVFYIQEGKVKLTVVSKIGKEATIGILNKGDFFGEGCLAGQPLRLCSATAMTDCSVMRIDKKSMVEVPQEMVGTTRSRVSFFMNRFRKLGFIDYDVGDTLHIHNSLLNVLLQDEDGISVTAGAENPTARAHKTSEPPPRPGQPPDKDRARRPPLLGLERHRN